MYSKSGNLSNGPLYERSTGLASMIGILEGVHGITEVFPLHTIPHTVTEEHTDTCETLQYNF